MKVANDGYRRRQAEDQARVVVLMPWAKPTLSTPGTDRPRPFEPVACHSIAAEKGA